MIFVGVVGYEERRFEKKDKLRKRGRRGGRNGKDKVEEAIVINIENDDWGMGGF